MPCENIVITIEETNEIIEIIINDFTVSNILSEDIGNSAILGTDGKVFVPASSGGVENHSELNLDDGTNPHSTTKSDVGLSNVDNTSDVNKPVSNAQQLALGAKEDVINKTDSGTGASTDSVGYFSRKGVYNILYSWFGTLLFGYNMTTFASKTTPIDADLITLSDQADGDKAKKVTFLQMWNNYFKVKADALFLNKDFALYADATLPLSDTDEFLVNQGGVVKKVEKSDIQTTQKYFDIVSNTTLNATHNNSILRIKATATVTIPSGMPSDFNFVVAIYTGATYTQVAGGGVTQVPTSVSKAGEGMLTTFVDGTNNYKTFGL